jgi:cation transport regulator
MQYNSIVDLPEPVRNNLPKLAQVIYMKAFNNAWTQYDDPDERHENASREEVAHKVAWSAVKQVYKKRNGKWVRNPD